MLSAFLLIKTNTRERFFRTRKCICRPSKQTFTSVSITLQKYGTCFDHQMSWQSRSLHSQTDQRHLALLFRSTINNKRPHSISKTQETVIYSDNECYNVKLGPLTFFNDFTFTIVRSRTPVFGSRSVKLSFHALSRKVVEITKELCKMKTLVSF